MEKTIYLLCGHGGRITNGLGQELSKRGYDVVGRETVGDFKKLDFDQQVAIIAEDLKANFWHEDSRVIANSYGAYLFLHAQTMMAAYIGKVMLLSPIVGEFSNEDIRMGFIPPYSKRLFVLASSNSYPRLKQCEIHVGSEDWQSNPQNVTAFADLLDISVSVVNDEGHSLSKQYVSAQLDRWL
jgi:alpha-beta hydrolase superfamily lysophospholipase